MKSSKLTLVMCAFLAFGYTTYAAVPFSVDDVGVMGGLACDTKRTKKQRCGEAGGGKCRSKIGVCVKVSGKKAKRLCGEGLGEARCTAVACTPANADSVNATCERGTKG